MPSVKSGNGTVTTVIARAACRADLAGSTLDLWPLYLFHPGAVTLNFALSIGTECRLTAQPGKQLTLISHDTGRQETFANLDEVIAAKSFKHPIAGYLLRFFRPEGGLKIETISESPAGAGISGSSALMIATTAALARYTGRKMDREEIRQLAQNVEAQIIDVPTGCQDYYPALYGGVNAVHLSPDAIRREALDVSPEEIESRFVLAYTGAPRKSGINNWEVFKAHIDGDKKVVRNFESISQISQQMRPAMIAADWKEVARLLRDEWKLRKSNYKGISTPLIDKLMSAAMKKGGVAAKVCGAGGGGCLVVMCEKGTAAAVSEALTKNGGQVLPFVVERDGVTVTAGKSAARSAGN